VRDSASQSPVLSPERKAAGDEGPLHPAFLTGNRNPAEAGGDRILTVSKFTAGAILSSDLQLASCPLQAAGPQQRAGRLANIRNLIPV
jgi:hypothetical protein